MAEHRKPTLVTRLLRAKRERQAAAEELLDVSRCFRCGHEVCDQCGACVRAVCINEDVPSVLRSLGPSR